MHSPGRRADALEQAVRELETLQRRLIAAPGKRAAPFLRTANRWHELLGPEARAARALAEGRREIPNRFVFGNPVQEEQHAFFTGRRDVAQRIERSIVGAAAAPTLLLHGARRMGKTSILNQLPRLLGPDFAPTVADCQNPAVTESREALLGHVSAAISAGLRRRHVEIKPLRLEPGAAERFGAFDRWLDAVEEALPGGMRVLLCLDEFERLQVALDAGWGGAVLDTLRHTLQHRTGIVLMFTGAHTFAELGPAWTDRFISARQIRVGLLSREEVLPLLTRPIPEFDLTGCDYAFRRLTT